MTQAAYVHIPFCVSKCAYCDFNSYAGMQSVFDDYVRALVCEIEQTAGIDLEGTPAPPAGPSGASGPHPGVRCLDSVYFGGGTPTILDAAQLTTVLDAIRRCFGIARDCEVTVEANPGTVDEAKLSALRNAGFNRLSLGVQSFDNEFLRSIGRAHTRAQALDAYAAAREAGFDNVGIDLIFALPGQTVAQWERTLDSATGLAGRSGRSPSRPDQAGCSGRSPSRPDPEHVSLYELSIEEGTRFAELCAEGRLQPLDEDVRVEMYELAIRKLSAAGYEHYEVSNFARPGFRSRHNTTYWHNQPYYGFGAGATSYVNGTRARRVAHACDYTAAIAKKGTVPERERPDLIEFSETLDPRARLGETIVLGLRMLEGVDLARVQADTGFDPLAEYAPEVERLTQRGLIELTDTHLRVTHSGLLLLNDVAREFV